MKDFNFVFLGQSVLKYKVPLDIFTSINEIYEKNKKQLHKANKQLIGKIEDETSLFYDGENTSKMNKHSILNSEIFNWFLDMFKHYLDFNNIKEYKMHLNSIWVNEMKEHEYNPIHIHQGSLYTGLSSVMILKVPKTFGEEYSSKDIPMNGRLQILGTANGHFAKTDYTPEYKIGDFFIFPYDMRHCVYPFNGTKEKRRTLAANCDVNYNPIINRGA